MQIAHRRRERTVYLRSLTDPFITWLIRTMTCSSSTCPSCSSRADSPQQSDTLVVPQGRGCEFLHFEAPGAIAALDAPSALADAAPATPAAAARRARRAAPAPQLAAVQSPAPAAPAGCLDYWAWNSTAARRCSDSRRALYSFVPILPCDAGTFGGVQYVCCADAGAANSGTYSLLQYRCIVLVRVELRKRGIFQAVHAFLMTSGSKARWD